MKDSALKSLFEEIMMEDGNTRCERCSTPQWTIWHTPDKPCTESASSKCAAASERSDSVGETASTDADHLVTR